MLDWFIVLTPMLLLPVALLLYFVGCSFDGDAIAVPDDVTYRISFYLNNNNLGHTYEFRIYAVYDDQSTEIARAMADTDSFDVSGGPSDSVQGTYSFGRSLEPGRVTLTCEVIGYGFIDNNDGPLPPPLVVVARGPGCGANIENNQQYLVEFNAGVSEDGIPDGQFDLPCDIRPI